MSALPLQSRHRQFATVYTLTHLPTFKNGKWVEPTHEIRIRDGLIASNNGNKARVRIADSNVTITLKSRRRGPIRTEFKYAIPYTDAVEILRTMCDGRVLDKVRHVITHAGVVWQGILNGVVLAEVELQHADQKFDLPGWIGKEVTGDPRYRKINMETQHIVAHVGAYSAYATPAV